MFNCFVTCSVSMEMREPFDTANLKLTKPKGTHGLPIDEWNNYEKLCRLHLLFNLSELVHD